MVPSCQTAYIAAIVNIPIVEIHNHPQRERAAPYNRCMALQPYLDTFPVLSEGVFAHPSSQIIGDVGIGRDSSIWCNTVLRGDVHRITVGECSNVQDFAMGHVSHRSAAKPAGAPLTIGSYVTIAHGVLLHGCTIGDECLVGMGSIVMDDVLIERHVMVGAGSLVAPGKVLKSGGLYVGRPAMRVRELSAQEIAYLRYSAEHYVRIKNNYLAQAADAAGPGS
ncbi:MAG: anhydrase [Pseudoduganella sp.]|jgi:carbonic anhydrase/acetyltransferase-like protein (isoleucine patch superfamily)|nr:anhydrase [Pseudoduganella sp.]